MKPQLLVNKKQIGLIHVAKADLVARGMLDEEGYRDCLAIYGDGAKSSARLTEAQADVLLSYFKTLGA